MSEKGTIQIESPSESVIKIIFSTPAHNALPSDLLQALANAIEEAGQKAARVIVLQSGGERTFCAGASFDELLQLQNEAESIAFFSGFANVILACRNSPSIVISRIQGKAIGGGVGLAAAADYCFATEQAAIRLSELAIGIGPFVIGPAVERKIGLSAFSQMALKPQQFFSAQWAQEKGLYHEVFQNIADMDNALHDFVAQLAQYSPQALTALKRAFWQDTSHWPTLLAERAATSGRLALSETTQTALKAFKKN
ncbi:MAG: enoyl-CoA hydratase/isomerase family protein [Runella sp.]